MSTLDLHRSRPGLPILADGVLLSLGDEDDGGGGSQCHVVQQILSREEHQGFSGVRKM